jgi:hypothetical protein
MSLASTTRSEIAQSLQAIGFMESSALGGYALRLPTEWVTGVVVLLEGCDPAVMLSTPAGSVVAHLNQPADVNGDAESRLAAAPTPSHVDCDICGKWHRKGESHCPNCGEPASSLFHASWDLEKCPYWLSGRWVMPEDFTDADRAELAKQRDEVTP